MYANCTVMTGKLAAVSQLPGNTLELLFASSLPLNVQGRVEIRLPIVATMTPAKQESNRKTWEALTGPKGYGIGDVIQIQGMTLYDPIAKSNVVVANSGPGGFTRIKTAPVVAAATSHVAPVAAKAAVAATLPPAAAVATAHDSTSPRDAALTAGALPIRPGMTKAEALAALNAMDDSDIPF